MLGYIVLFSYICTVIKNKSIMEIFKSSYELIKEIEALVIDKELRDEINLYIKANVETSKGFDNRFSNIMFRGNLTYIIDNITKGYLIADLRNLNKAK